MTTPMVSRKGKSRGNRFGSPFHKARIEVLQSLFAGEYLPGGPPPFSLTSTLPSQALQFRDRLKEGVIRNREEIDRTISRFSVDWKIERMGRIDRNILRMGICEILHEPDIPFRVTIDESLELAHQFSEPEAIRFINGILHQVGMRMNPEKAVKDEPPPDDDPGRKTDL